MSVTDRLKKLFKKEERAAELESRFSKECQPAMRRVRRTGGPIGHRGRVLTWQIER